MLSNFEKIDNHVIFAGYFNVFFDTSLDTKGGTPNLSMNKLIELNKTLDLFDIGRMKTLKKYKYTS